MSSPYDPQWVTRFYNDYAGREWQRFDTIPGSVSLHIHNHYLARYIRPGNHVLDAGAGPGRFTIELARLGARITVSDISPVQLDLNRERLAESGYEDAVLTRDLLDITDLSRYPDASFDAVVCYGGPISYVMDRASAAIAELLRVIRPGGYLLISVMSLLGTTRAVLPGVLEIAQQHGIDIVNKVNATGDIGPETHAAHRCHVYRWSELQALLSSHPCRIVAASASNFLSLNNNAALEPLRDNSSLWQAFLDWELDFCAQPGALDAGTHIVAILERT